MNDKITENDNHKMPVIFEGEMTPETIKKKEAAEKSASERKEHLKKVYNDRLNSKKNK